MRQHHNLKKQALGLAAMAALIALAGCSSTAESSESAESGAASEGLKVGFVNINADTYGTCLQNGIQAAADDAGVELVTANSNLDPAKEISNVEDMISRGVDAIILQTVNVDALAGGISKAKAAGIPLYLTAVLPQSQEDILGGAVVDLAGVGAMGAEWIAEDAAGEDVQVAVISGVPGAASDIMMGGLKEALPANATVVAEQPGMYNRGKAQDVAENIIQANPDLKYAFVQNEEMAFGASAAFKAAGADVRIVTSNGTDDGLKAVEAGEFQATIADSAFNLGNEAMTHALELLKDSSGEKITRADVLMVTKQNVAEAPKYCG